MMKLRKSKSVCFEHLFACLSWQQNHFCLNIKGIAYIQIRKLFECKIVITFLPFKRVFLGAQKNRLIETVLLSTHMLWSINKKKILLNMALLFGDLAL